ncbi:cytochrome P450 [Armillaria novae-zelandiae]|uniref:Cytochrome P450 n=1 Tax=Armillaria novae-zelandiae TaxID=153914 RepID=A0AA39TAD5_9AGAR|nr:cytochrome P450 [Armillaria novae-zelandiae]
MLSVDVSAIAFAASLLVVGLALFWISGLKDLKFPPGPKQIPVAGCALVMPTKNEHQTFSKWADEFGRIVGLKVFGQRLVLLNTSEVATELLNARNSIYSHRPDFPMLEMMSFPKWNVGIMNTGSIHRSARQMLGQSMNSKAIHLYHDIMANEVRCLLKYIRDSPSEYARHLRRLNANIILRVFYGVQPDRVETENLVTLNNKLLDATSLAGAPLAYLVNTFPILKYWPRFLPGGSFKADVEVGSRLVEELFTIPIFPVDTKETMPFLSMYSSDKSQHDLARSVAATAFSAGVETSTSMLLSFVLAMVHYPDVQRKAQAEIDAKLSGILPTVKDRLNTLPYVDAILSECFRWAPPGHLGLPHCLSQDDSIDGYHLPRGTVVLPNIWNILHDSRRHSNPMEFMPERFLGANPESDPREHVYGYGRRLCPGRYLAEDNLWLAMASMLALFNFRMASGANGQPISPAIEFTSGVMNRPRDFKCLIESRSLEASGLVLHKS